ncbi:MAG: hypothetical protein R3B40_04565 [Polyangiales bacterium]|nr:hypothetical protein [Myxococcales bacterium]MCB9662163.1 hypothetical protein [Sandaracinaceae bacterium]
MRLHVTCAPGLTGLLSAELSALLLLAGRPADALTASNALGVEAVVVDVDDACGFDRIALLNLGLGLATSVRVELASFSASQFPQLVRKLRQVAWGPWVSPTLPLDLRVRSVKSRLYHTKAIAERTRRAIEESLRSPSLATLDEGSDVPHTRIHVDALENRFHVTVDTSGEPLYRRGYRLATGKAPLRPDLARALVLVSGWDRATPLGDPFCGAGTVLVEAALLATGRAPGAGRSFAFQYAPAHVATVLDAAAAQLSERVSPRTALPPLLGSDRDAGVIASAHENAERAGVAQHLTLSVAPVSDAPVFTQPLGPRVLVSNPPYGVRVGDERTLRNLYQRTGSLVRSLPQGSRAAFLTPPQRARDFGLTLARAFESNHGGQHVVASVTQG